MSTARKIDSDLEKKIEAHFSQKTKSGHKIFVARVGGFWYCENCQQDHEGDTSRIYKNDVPCCEDSIICGSCGHDELLITGDDKTGEVLGECGLCAHLIILKEK